MANATHTGTGSAMKNTILLFLSLWMIHSTQAAPPNLLVIQTDEHNFRTLGCYRDTLPPEQALVWGKDAVLETPNIDWLAKQGALCTSFYATTPVCSPSRAALISGRYPQNTPVVNNNVPLSNDVVTFAELLKRRGYRTGYVGKWHLDGSGKPQWQPKRNFGFEDNRFMFNRGHWKKFEDTPEGPRVGARKNGKPSYDLDGADEESFATDWLTTKVIKFIESDKEQPFCMMVALPDPHGPNTVRAPYNTQFSHIKFELPATMTNPGETQPFWGKAMVQSLQNQSMQQYFGMVKCIDDNVGRIIEALRKQGRLENTMIVFTADHGDLCGEHCRHNKGNPYEASAKVPFIMYYPPKVKAGTVINEALSCVDFLPTAFSLFGYKTAGLEQGRDASTLFRTGKAPADWKDLAFLRSTGSADIPSAWLCVVSDQYKLVFSNGDIPWLYDLETDPDEVVNALHEADHRDRIRTMSQALQAYGEQNAEPFIALPRIKADIAWAVGDVKRYATPNPVAPAEKAPGKRKRKQAAAEEALL
jgi:arylsulfatase A-like enzyme